MTTMTTSNRTALHTYRVEDAATREVLQIFQTEETISEISASLSAAAHKRAVFVIDAESGAAKYAP